MKSIYSDEFRDAHAYAKDKNLYLGKGNPASSILIVGKEPSIDVEQNNGQ